MEMIRTLVSQGYSANKIQKILQKQGLGIRRKKLLTIVRALKGVPKKPQTWKYVPKKYRPEPSPRPVKRVTVGTNITPVHGKTLSFTVIGYGKDADVEKLEDTLWDMIRRHRDYHAEYFSELAWRIGIEEDEVYWDKDEGVEVYEEEWDNES